MGQKSLTIQNRGGYEDGYNNSPSFWEKEPGSLVRSLVSRASVANRRVLDAGAGEGKNAYYLAERGAEVTAVEISARAIHNGRRRFGPSPAVNWVHDDISTLSFSPNSFDVVVCYGLLHCLPSREAIGTEIQRYQASTSPGGWHATCVFNDRSQDLSAHPNFHPTLLTHSFYTDLYADWEVISASDTDLIEAHPHNKIVHTHSMTRILARRSSDA